VRPLDTLKVRDENAAVGDGGNDVQMLRWAARGVAMGHASDAVRASADEVTGTDAADDARDAAEHATRAVDKGGDAVATRAAAVKDAVTDQVASAAGAARAAVNGASPTVAHSGPPAGSSSLSQPGGASSGLRKEVAVGALVALVGLYLLRKRRQG